MNNKLYGWIRKEHASRLGKYTSKPGDLNSQYGTMWIFNRELRESKKIKKNEIVPNGWELGRVIDFDRFELLQKDLLKKKRNDRLKKEELQRKYIRQKHRQIKQSKWYRKAKAERLYNEFKTSGMSLRAFASSKDLVAMTISNQFNSFIPEYANSVTARVSASKSLGGAQVRLGGPSVWL